MENPWKEMTEVKGEYIAPCDRAVIDGLPTEKRNRLQFQYFPQPYMGNPDTAKIFLLNLNPNAKDNHCEFNKKHSNVIRASLEHKLEQYPLYALNPKFNEYFIHKWWHRHLHFLETGERITLETISKKIFVAEYFPYFSDHFIKGIPLASQKYTFHLIEKAMKQKKTIVIMRSKNIWYESITGLEKYNGLILLNNPRNPCVSPGNMQSDDFKKIIRTLE